MNHEKKGENPRLNLKYSVGVSTSKNKFKACLSLVNNDHQIKVLAIRSFKNKKTGFKECLKWTEQKSKGILPILFAIEETEYYYELASYLHKRSKKVSVISSYQFQNYSRSLEIQNKNNSTDTIVLSHLGTQEGLVSWEAPMQDVESPEHAGSQEIQIRKEMSEFIVYFLAYLCICDEYIDNREVDYIEAYIQKNALPIDTLDNVFKIYGNEDDKIKIEKVQQTISLFTYNELVELFKTSYELMYCDEYLDGREEKLLLGLNTELKLDDTILCQIKEDAKEKTYPTKNKQNLLTDDISLSDFKKLITKIEQISIEDIKYVKEYFEKNSKSLNHLIQNIEELISNLRQSNTTSDDTMINGLTEIKQKMETIRNKRIQKNDEAIINKERSVKNFTISFLGRTQAGKSTLHSILSNEGFNFVGKGGQRTTRYKRAYLWNKLKFIDTPGIGAADAGGEIDTQIAISAIEETDIVCFVLSTPPQLSEFDFLFKEIKEKNKPIMILVNYNYNSNLINYAWEQFLQNSHSWLTEKDKRNTKGRLDETKDQIREYFSVKYPKLQNQLDKIIVPVHLLIAKKAMALSDEKLKNELIESSKIKTFTHAISKSIIEEGIMRRSQNFIDGTTQNIRQTKDEILQYQETIKKLKVKLEQKNSNIETELQNITKEFQRKIRLAIEQSFNGINTIQFANQYYDSSESTINYQWKSLLTKEIESLTRKNGKLEQLLEEYKARIENYFKEMSENLDVYFDLIFDIGDIKIDTSTNWREFFKGISKIVDYVAKVTSFIPGLPMLVGIVLTVIGKVIGWFSNLFKSSERIRNEKIENLNRDLIKSKNLQRDTFIDKFMYSFEAQTSKIVKEAQNGFSSLSTTFNKVNISLEYLIEKIKQQENALNQVLAWRIVNFAIYLHDNKNYNRLPIEINFSEMNQTIRRFFRNNNDFTIEIQNSANMDLPKMSEQLTSILQESITLKG